jgi:hypothetical protein
MLFSRLLLPMPEEIQCDVRHLTILHKKGIKDTNENGQRGPVVSRCVKTRYPTMICFYQVSA